VLELMPRGEGQTIAPVETKTEVAKMPQLEGNGRQRTRRIPTVLWYFVALAIGAAEALRPRFDIDADALTYVDMASEVLKGNLPHGLSSHYHPGFPIFLAAVLAVFKPTPYFESTVVYGAAFLTFTIALSSFEFLLHELQRLPRMDSNTSQTLPPVHIVLLCRLTFLWSSLKLTNRHGAFLVSPDMLVSAAIYLAAGLLVRIKRGDARIGIFAALGITTGLGFWVKEAFGPLTVVFIACAALLARRQERPVRRVAVLVACVSIIALPLCVMLSQLVGAMTCGRTASFHYFRFVNGFGSALHWQGEPPGFGVPRHPTRIVHLRPAVYEFGSPIPGTYPPLYDIGYWFDGIKPRVDLFGHLRTMRHSLGVYRRSFGGNGASFVLAVLVLGCTASSQYVTVMRLRSFWWLIAPAGAGVLMYAVVYTEPRYIAGFVTLLVVAFVQSVSYSAGEAQRVGRVVVAVIGIGWFLPEAYNALRTLIHEIPMLAKAEAVGNRDWSIAKQLDELGVKRGAFLGYVGATDHFYWARLAGCKVVAEIREEDVSTSGYSSWMLSEGERARRREANGDIEMFWTGSQAARAEVMEAFRTAAVRTVVADGVPPGADMTGWVRLAGTDFFVYRIR
jgi:hypothetical protein